MPKIDLILSSASVVCIFKYEVVLFSLSFVLLSVLPKRAFALARYVLLLSSLSKIDLTLFSVSVVCIFKYEVVLFSFPYVLVSVLPKSALALAR